MIKRRTSLESALGEIEDGTTAGVSGVVVNRGWWQQLPADVQDGYHRRCAQLRIDLRVDDALSRHFVELASGSDDPPLSTEHLV